MNEEQLKFLESKPYLKKAFASVTEEDAEIIKSINPEKASKEDVKKLQNILKKMTLKMTFKEKAGFGIDLIKFLKLGKNGEH